MKDFTFASFVELIVWLIIYGSIVTAIEKSARPSRAGMKFIYFIGLFITYFIFTTIANLFGYESQLLNMR